MSPHMTILGLILLILGFVFGIHLLWILGLVLLIIGVVLLIVRPGSRYYW